ncbi:MAG TPA: helix-turn-helix domain-containing protein, partial [Xanthomonadales bacterium]|nr:helix-turn-helix domain-containing protein [Xanthomonadales bacterium]
MNDKLYTVKEAADILKVSIKTLHRWEERGILTPDRTTGNHRRYKLADIEALKNRTKNPQSPYITDTETPATTEVTADSGDSIPPITLSDVGAELPNNNLGTLQGADPLSLTTNPNDEFDLEDEPVDPEVFNKIELASTRPLVSKVGFAFLGVLALIIGTAVMAGAGIFPGISGISSREKPENLASKLTNTSVTPGNAKSLALEGEISFNI